VQGAAKRSWSGDGTFRAELLRDEGVARWLDAADIEGAMDLDSHLAGIDVTFRALDLAASKAEA